MKTSLCLLALGAAAAISISARAQVVTPMSVTGTGDFNNSLGLIVDGVFPPEETNWQDSGNVWWTGEAPNFTLDYGSPIWLTQINLSVDNNDDYEVDTSLDGVNFTPLFTILDTDGNVPVSPGGMDTMSSDPSNPEFVGDMAFAPLWAQYVRIEAVGGDGLYAIGELEASTIVATNAVPEPSTYGLMGAGALAALALVRRRRTAK